MIQPQANHDCITPINDFAPARQEKIPAHRLERLRQVARAFGERFRAGPQVVFFKSVPLIRAPYPAHYGFLNARSWQFPFIHILNRMFIVQVRSPVGLKTLLLSPSWVEGGRQTPFFQRLQQSFGPFQELGRKLMAPEYNTVESALAAEGIAPEQVDYISYDHMHTQDVRRWLGNGQNPGVLPRARLLIMREEWESCQGLTAPQADWYVRDGLKDVPQDRIVVLDSDVQVGEGLALIKTPGHTMGNHSFVVNTPEGSYVISENGVGPDCYAPQNSRIRDFRRYHARTGMEVVLNGNTLEGGLEQYISMVVEKEIAGPSRINPAFPNLFNSSEFTHYWAFPGHRPTFNVGDRCFGRFQVPTTVADEHAGAGAPVTASRNTAEPPTRRAVADMN